MCLESVVQSELGSFLVRSHHKKTEQPLATGGHCTFIFDKLG